MNDKQLRGGRASSTGILQVFLNVDLRNGHDGLAEIASGSRINVLDLNPGQYVVFINGTKDKVKVYAANNVIAYHKSAHGRLEMGAIQLIPRCFKGGVLRYDDAVKKVLESVLRKGNT